MDIVRQHRKDDFIDLVDVFLHDDAERYTMKKEVATMTIALALLSEGDVDTISFLVNRICKASKLIKEYEERQMEHYGISLVKIKDKKVVINE
ncbi:MAG: hypothetical protein ACRDD8_16000 [Bacteroidales bacterium]